MNNHDKSPGYLSHKSPLCPEIPHKILDKSLAKRQRPLTAVQSLGRATHRCGAKLGIRLAGQLA